MFKCNVLRVNALLFMHTIYTRFMVVLPLVDTILMSH